MVISTIIWVVNLSLLIHGMQAIPSAVNISLNHGSVSGIVRVNNHPYEYYRFSGLSLSIDPRNVGIFGSHLCDTQLPEHQT